MTYKSKRNIEDKLMRFKPKGLFYDDNVALMKPVIAENTTEMEF